MAEIFTHRHAIEMWKHFPMDMSGYVSDDSAFSDKAVIRQLQESRSALTKEAMLRGDDVSEQMVQTLPCVEVTEMDRNECPCAPASGCYWLKSDTVIPKFIKINSITGIVAHGEMPRFTFIKWDRFQYIPKSRVASMRKGRFWTVRDTGEEGLRLYLYGDRFLETISISGIWEDPMCVAAFPKCGEVNVQAKCFPLDVDFYTDSWLRESIMRHAWQKLVPVRQTAPLDAMNDDIVHNNPLGTEN